jgi:hypothetical protein
MVVFFTNIRYTFLGISVKQDWLGLKWIVLTENCVVFHNGDKHSDRKINNFEYLLYTKETTQLWPNCVLEAAKRIDSGLNHSYFQCEVLMCSRIYETTRKFVLVRTGERLNSCLWIIFRKRRKITKDFKWKLFNHPYSRLSEPLKLVIVTLQDFIQWCRSGDGLDL